MKKILSMILVLATLMLAFSAVSCGKEDVTILRSFLAGSTVEDKEYRSILNLMSDGTAVFYSVEKTGDTSETALYNGTYTLGENEEFDETVTVILENGTLAENAVILDGMFEASNPGGGTIKLYETAPVSMDGDIYVGYLAKTGGMGAMVYAYALTLRDDGTFDVSIMQMATVMHVWDKSTGTYVKDGDTITFTYDASDGEGGVAAEDFVSEGTITGETTISVGFNIAQTAVRAANAPFVKILDADK